MHALVTTAVFCLGLNVEVFGLRSALVVGWLINRQLKGVQMLRSSFHVGLTRWWCE